MLQHLNYKTLWIALLSTIAEAWAVKLSCVYIIRTIFLHPGAEYSFQFPMIMFLAIDRKSFPADRRGAGSRGQERNEKRISPGAGFMSGGIVKVWRPGWGGEQCRAAHAAGGEAAWTRRRPGQARGVPGDEDQPPGGHRGGRRQPGSLGSVAWPPRLGCSLCTYSSYAPYRVPTRLDPTLESVLKTAEHYEKEDTVSVTMTWFHRSPTGPGD